MEETMQAQEVVQATQRPMKQHEDLKRIAKWGKFTGVVMMIFGGISAAIGIFAFIVGAIPGALTCWMGFMIHKTGKGAESMIYSGRDDELPIILENYGKFLSVNGILIVVSFVIGILSFAIMGSLMAEIFYYL